MLQLARSNATARLAARRLQLVAHAEADLSGHGLELDLRVDAIVDWVAGVCVREAPEELRYGVVRPLELHAHAAVVLVPDPARAARLAGHVLGGPAEADALDLSAKHQAQPSRPLGQGTLLPAVPPPQTKAKHEAAPPFGRPKPLGVQYHQ